MNCSGKVTHFITLVERYLQPASRNSAATDGEVHGRVFGMAIFGRTANKSLLARQQKQFVMNHLPPALEAGKYTIRGASPTWPPGRSKRPKD